MAKPTTVSDKGTSPIATWSIETRTERIRLLIDAKVEITGTVTNTKYLFQGAGSIVEVEREDVNEILNKKRGRSCCGGTSGRNIFELVEE